jgi:LysM repeat protein
MNNSLQNPNPDSLDKDKSKRCPVCDSVLQLTTNGRCLMCGADVDLILDEQMAIEESRHDTADQVELESAQAILDLSDEQEPPTKLGPEFEQLVEPTSIEGARLEDDEELTHIPVVESVLHERQSRLTIVMAIGVFVVVCILGFLVIQNPAAATLALFPTSTSLPPTQAATSTWTPLATITSPPTDTPTITSTPPPTDTPKPPRSHNVALGETLFGLSLRYGVTMESIAEVNGLPAGSGIQVSQQLIIPWPTATPPLAPVEIEIVGETVIADPTDCQMYEIKGGDTFFGISARARVDLQAILAVNRLTEQSVLQPGDVICIPEIIHGGAIPPTAGPSPTPTATEPPAGPHLLFPANGTVVETPGEPLFLQWAAVKDLEDDEWYMVELTDLTDVDSHPLRGFTRQSSFSVPGSWRPAVPEEHVFRWRVRIVQVVGEREDGSFIYTFGGSNSDEAFFTWLGAIPTSTPTATFTPQPE